MSITSFSDGDAYRPRPAAEDGFVQRVNGANAQYHQQLVVYHTTGAQEATNRYFSYPEREREGGLSISAARHRAILVAVADAPAMLATVEAARVADPVTFLSLAIAATAFNAWLGWEIGTLARADREPTPPTRFNRLRMATVLLIAAIWIASIVVIRASFASVWAFGIPALAISIFLTAFAVGSLSLAAGYAYRVDSDRVSDARADRDDHLRAKKVAERALAMYNRDIQAASRGANGAVS